MDFCLEESRWYSNVNSNRVWLTICMLRFLPKGQCELQSISQHVLCPQTLRDNPCKQTVSGSAIRSSLHQGATSASLRRGILPKYRRVPPSTLHNLVEMPWKGIACPRISLIRWNKLREPGKAVRKCPRPTLIGNCFPALANQRARLVARKTALSFYTHGITIVFGFVSTFTNEDHRFTSAAIWKRWYEPGMQNMQERQADFTPI